MDPYEILQVDRRADLDVIRAAYRVLARRHHPDVGGNPRQMAAVNQAWAILSDPAKRARYDASMRRARIVAEAAAANGAAPSAGVPTMRPTPPAAAPAERVEVPTYQPMPKPVNHEPGPGVLDFGRYAGWSVTELSRHDPDYLLWLERTPIGRPLRSEIQRAMELRRTPVATAPVGRAPVSMTARLFGRS